jgi:NADH-quinone oxidoreductase subunit J
MTFFAIFLLMILGALGAVLLRSLLHCGLSLAIAFVGLAAFYLHLGAQFAGFAQVLVYVGAVAVLVLFAVLLTGGVVRNREEPVFSPSWLAGLTAGVLVLVVTVGCILASRSLNVPLPAAPNLPVRQIGDELMTRYVLALEVIGLLLTAALIGAMLIAASESSSKSES